MGTMTVAPGLARKLRKVLETRTDSPDLLASLSALSSFYTDNTQQARRSLRATIERRGLSINDEFLRASESAQKALEAVELEVAGLAECCERYGLFGWIGSLFRLRLIFGRLCKRGFLLCEAMICPGSCCC